MHEENLERLGEYLRAHGYKAALLSSPWTITWLTGYAPPIQTGPSPFEGGPAMAWWLDGGLTLLVSDAESAAARASGAEVLEYAGYTIDAPIAAVEHQAAALRDLLEAGRPRPGDMVAVELRFLPSTLGDIPHDSLKAARLQPVDVELEPLRALKTPEEIRKLRAALALCDVSQEVAAVGAQPGVSEIALWGHIKGALEARAGMRLPVMADLVGGARTGEVGGLPGEYMLREGDPVIADVVPRLDGYWGDICGTHFAGEPPAEMRRPWAVVRETLRHVVDAVRPGVKACDLDALARNAIRDAGYEPYPHHTGHGLGASWHEEPRIVPYNELTLEPGMVFALEPGIYLPGIGGVRLEDVVLVTVDGCELLTTHLAGR